MYSTSSGGLAEKGDWHGEPEVQDGFSMSDDEIDQEEIEQALYAQIYYCQDEGEKIDENKKYDIKCLENGKVVDNKLIVEDKQFSVKSSKIKRKSPKVKKSTNEETEESYGLNDFLDTYSDSPLELGSSDSVISINSDFESDYGSDYEIDSDCMMLDDSCDDMGDIVVNINENQKTMVNNLTVRKMKEKENKGSWSIIDQDRFSGNPLLKRYHAPLSVRCHNCNEIGHLSKVCPKPKKVIVCYLCGESGHHGKACHNPICFNCYTPGHVTSDCSSQRRSRYIDCHRCQMLGHASRECPEIWRQFHLTTSIGPLVRVKHQEQSRKHCPNCAGDDHFDYECEEERMDRHYLPTYPFISQYRKYDVRIAKRHRENITEDTCEEPTKKIKFDTVKIDRTIENDFIRSPLNNTDNNIKSKKRKDKKKVKDKKVENFRKMMDNDDFTFRNQKHKNPSKNILSQKERKALRKDKKTSKKEKKFKKKHLSLEEQYYGPLPDSKKKKKKSKKDKKSKPSNASRGFRVHGSFFDNV